MERMVEISKYNWPQVKGSALAWEPGDVALVHSTRGAASIRVVVRSPVRRHLDAPGNGLVCEVEYPASAGGGIFAVSADQLEPLFMREKEKERSHAT